MIESISALSQGPAVGPTQVKPVDPSSGADAEAFGEALASAIDNVDAVREAADSKLAGLASGENVDLHGTMIALSKADVVLRTMVTVRDKAIGAYEAIMNMAI